MVHGAAVTEAVVRSAASGQVEKVTLRRAYESRKRLGHLTYSTLVHPADNWEQLWKSVKTYLPQVKARVSPDEKFGVCLRTGGAVGRARSSADPSKRADLKQFFADNDLYLYTANAFVYGVFKKQVIKEQVYEPDWAHRRARRLHDEGGQPARGARARGHQPVDPERAARLQAEGHRRRRRRDLHDERHRVVAHLVEAEQEDRARS